MHITLRHALIAGTALIGLGAFASAAVAQPAPPGAAGPQPPMAAGKPGPRHDMAGKVEARITDLHARLLITPAQQPQWNAFIQVMRDNAKSMDMTFQQRKAAVPAMTAPENMQSYAAVTTEHAQQTQKLVPAFVALYETMSDSQKRTADQVFRDDAHHGDPKRRG